MTWFFFFFFVSGFCGVLYELIWLRLSMAQFGVTTALTSMVLSVFMAGLGLGSWVAGAALRRKSNRLNFSSLRLYALLAPHLRGGDGALVGRDEGVGERVGGDLVLGVVRHVAGGPGEADGVPLRVAAADEGDVIRIPRCTCRGEFVLVRLRRRRLHGKG